MIHNIFIDKRFLNSEIVNHCLSSSIELANLNWRETDFAEYANVLISPNPYLISAWLQQHRFADTKIYYLTFRGLPTELMLVDARQKEGV